MSTSTLRRPRPIFALGSRRATSVLGNRRFVARAGWALVIANVRYWCSVAPIVRDEVRRWELRAQAIEDPDLRALALEKLQREGFHAQAAAMLATLAPRTHRKDAAEAIVALELLYDYLDGATELPSPDPLTEGSRLFMPYCAAVVPRSEGRRKLVDRADGDYLQALSDTISNALHRLPAAPAVTCVALVNAADAAQTQVRMHAVPQLGAEQLEQWARSRTDAGNHHWRDFLAGAASSVLLQHALIAAAADPSTGPAESVAIQNAYLSICTLLTLLDGLVDHDEDTQSAGAGGSATPLRPGYIDLYADPDELSQTLSGAARAAASRVRALRHAPHHAITLVGVVAYYTSTPGARGKFASPISKRLQRELSPLIYPTLAVMRTWRLAKRIRNRRPARLGGLT